MIQGPPSLCEFDLRDSSLSQKIRGSEMESHEVSTSRFRRLLEKSRERKLKASPALFLASNPPLPAFDHKIVKI